MEKGHKGTLKFCFSVSIWCTENDRENNFFCILILYRFLPFLSPYLLAHTFCHLYQNLYPSILAAMLQTLDFPFLQHKPVVFMIL